VSRTDQPQIDTSQPSIARVYDVFLGGKDNFEVDRAVYAQIAQIAPEARTTGLQCRAWLIRVVRHLAGEAGIDQFLDCGSGLPTAENTHQAAQRINPRATVVYVDNDPSVAAHGRALLEENDHTHFGVADLRDPAALLSTPAVATYLDFDRPIALIQCNTLHHVADEDKPRDIMAAYIDALPSGSYVAICHLHDPADGSSRSELARDAQARFMSLMGTCRFRTRAEISSFFCGLDLIEPGLTHPYLWRPDEPQLDKTSEEAHLLLGGVARVP
jgi:hypothetical protein